MEAEHPSVVVIEDHVLLREALVRLLRSEADLCVEASASTGEAEELFARAQVKPDVLVVGVGLPHFAGLALLRDAPQAAPGARAVGLLHRLSDPVLTQVLGTGALACVSYEDRYESFVESVRRAAASEPYVSPRLAPLLVSAASGQGGSPLGPGTLSRRERQVLILVAEGLSTREIAGQLGLSPRTVETHRARLMSKLQVRRTSQLIRIAVEEGLVAH